MSANFWAGYVSGAAGILIGNPLDLLKVRLQAGESISAASSHSLSGQFETASALIRGTEHVLVEQMKIEDTNKDYCVQASRHPLLAMGLSMPFSSLHTTEHLLC